MTQREPTKLMELIYSAFGEVSALFMSQPIKGIDIVMPEEDLTKIANRLIIAINELVT